MATKKTPDFKQLAWSILSSTGRLAVLPHDLPSVERELRKLWNARGVSDLKMIEPIIDKLGDAMDPDNAREFVTDAIKSVDI